MAESSRDTVAVLGTGIMGSAMARNLLRAGFAVRAWDRTAEKASALQGDGAIVASTAAEAAQGADVMLTMLADADAVADVVESGPLQAGVGIWVQAGTIGVEGTERMAALAGRHGVAFVDAPVLGTRQPAEEGKLRVLASGPPDALDRCQPLFEAIGSRTVRLGAAGQGTRLKLATNLWVLTVVEGTAECLVLAEHLGIDPERVLDAIGDGPLDLPYAQSKAEAMLGGRLEAAFPLRHAAKDAELMRAAGDGVDLRLLAAIADALAAGVRDGHGDLDVAATFLSRRASVARR